MKGTFGDKEKKKEKKKKAQELAANAAKKPAVRRGAVPPPFTDPFVSDCVLSAGCCGSWSHARSPGRVLHH